MNFISNIISSVIGTLFAFFFVFILCLANARFVGEVLGAFAAGIYEVVDENYHTTKIISFQYERMKKDICTNTPKNKWDDEMEKWCSNKGE